MNRHQSQKFKTKVWSWYQTHAPSLPWRKTRNPYHIFISEVMLQQTQIPRVLEKYPLFLKRFPTIARLARAPLHEVLITWQGMGYNRRGAYLKRAAETMMANHRGRVPKTEQELRNLAGIGPYSARAIMCFAHGICQPFIETNIRRAVIHELAPKLRNGQKPWLVSDKEVLAALECLHPTKNPRAWYWALMDYGRDAVKHVPNPNRRSAHYAKQSRFEGSPRYVRAQILKYVLANKKAIEEELFLSLKEDRHLRELSHKDIARACASLRKENLIAVSGRWLKIR